MRSRRGSDPDAPPRGGEIARGRTLGGKYRLERLLARGGMGEVWDARHLVLDTHVAIKFMDKSLLESSDARMRFEREAKAAAKLRTPHVVQIHDSGVDQGAPFIVMELLQGVDLAVRLRKERRLSVPATVRVVSQIAKALRVAHEAGVIHRDLKPGNVFLARTADDEEIVKVLDFGIAKAQAGLISDATKTGELLGSPEYMSPEQARGLRNVDHRSDLWSLAVIAYRAITGVKPFRGESVGDIIVKICIEPVEKPTMLVADLRPELDEFFERAFSRDPDGRFSSARELADAFAIAAGTLSIPGDVASASSNLSLRAGHASEPPAVFAPPPPSSPGAVGEVLPPPSPGTAPEEPPAPAVSEPSLGPSAVEAQTLLLPSPDVPTELPTGTAFSSQTADRRRSRVLLATGLGVFGVILSLGFLVLSRGGPAPEAPAASGATEVAPPAEATTSVPTPTETPSVLPEPTPAASAVGSSRAPRSSPAANAAPPAKPAAVPARPAHKKPDFGY